MPWSSTGASQARQCGGSRASSRPRPPRRASRPIPDTAPDRSIPLPLTTASFRVVAERPAPHPWQALAAGDISGG
ncbi:hypothetical protein EAH89_27695 [Roseomonas nepalensis]|uniref:Uncharacterized protein n=1 Tax=Muricoccus nepalensis TaxID=1854500 RepID=A0A502F338_9PROT|nr:hypothetical protein EAH89_27695 [Roseomonas nepalensis]